MKKIILGLLLLSSVAQAAPKFKYLDLVKFTRTWTEDEIFRRCDEVKNWYVADYGTEDNSYTYQVRPAIYEIGNCTAGPIIKEKDLTKVSDAN